MAGTWPCCKSATRSDGILWLAPSGSLASHLSVSLCTHPVRGGVPVPSVRHVAALLHLCSFGLGHHLGRGMALHDLLAFLADHSVRSLHLNLQLLADHPDD